MGYGRFTAICLFQFPTHITTN